MRNGRPRYASGFQSGNPGGKALPFAKSASDANVSCANPAKPGGKSMTTSLKAGICSRTEQPYEALQPVESLPSRNGDEGTQRTSRHEARRERGDRLARISPQAAAPGSPGSRRRSPRAPPVPPPTAAASAGTAPAADRLAPPGIALRALLRPPGDEVAGMRPSPRRLPNSRQEPSSVTIAETARMDATFWATAR